MTTLAFGEQHVINQGRTIQITDPNPFVNVANVTCSPIGFPNILQASAQHSVEIAAVCELQVDKKCLVTQVPTGDDCQGKVQEAIFEYTGGDCTITNTQGGKATCDGAIPGEFVDVSSLSDGLERVISVDSEGTVTVAFTHSSGQFSSTTGFTVQGTDGNQVLEIHTSCSKPLAVGDQFGSMRLVELTTTEGGHVTEAEPVPSDACEFPFIVPSCETTGKPGNLTFDYTGAPCSASQNGQGADKFECSPDPGFQLAALDFVTVTRDADKVFATVDGTEVTLTNIDGRFRAETEFTLTDVNGNTQSLNIHTSCSQPLEVGDSFGALTLVAMDGHRVGAEVKYFYNVSNLGATAVADISVTDVIDDGTPGGAPGPEVYCEGDSLAGGASMTCMSSAIIDGGPDTVVTNIGRVSTPLFGVCHTDSATVTVTPPPPCEIEGGSLRIRDDAIEWELFNPGPRNATISKIDITWPDEKLGGLEKVKRGKKTLYNTLREEGAVSIEEFLGSEKDRTIKVGRSEKIKFEFVNKASTTQDEYTITIWFEEGCLVEFQAEAGVFDCRNSKPIDELTMIWNGTGDFEFVDIRAYKGAVGTNPLPDLTGIHNGDEVTFSGLAGSPNDIYWEIYEGDTLALGGGDAVLLGVSKFHLSCSDPEMNGPEDCGKAQGDGKDNDPSWINDWTLEGIVGSTSSLDCSWPSDANSSEMTLIDIDIFDLAGSSSTLASLSMMSRELNGEFLDGGIIADFTEHTIEWRTNERTTSVVYYGTDKKNLDQVFIDLELETWHSVTITGLIPGKKYYYRIEGEDYEGNFNNPGKITICHKNKKTITIDYNSWIKDHYYHKDDREGACEVPQ